MRPLSLIAVTTLAAALAHATPQSTSPVPAAPEHRCYSHGRSRLGRPERQRQQQSVDTAHRLPCSEMEQRWRDSTSAQSALRRVPSFSPVATTPVATSPARQPEASVWTSTSPPSPRRSKRRDTRRARSASGTTACSIRTTPNGRGFDEFYGFCSGHWGDYFSPPLEHNGRRVRGKGYVTDDFTDKAIGFMERNRNRPVLRFRPVLHTPFSDASA